MNVEVIGRIRPPLSGEVFNLDLDNNKITSHPDSISFNFNDLHKPDVSTYHVFKNSFESLVQLWISGFNTSILIVGETGSGKSFSLNDESSSRPGFISCLFDYLFQQIPEDHKFIYNQGNINQENITFEMYELKNELIRDLNTKPSINPQYLELEETSTDGIFVKGGRRLKLENASKSISLFRQAWSNITGYSSDFGLSKSFSTLYIKLQLISKINGIYNKSNLTLFVIPGFEQLEEKFDVTIGINQNKALHSFQKLVKILANKEHAHHIINYRESKLTRLLQDELGGNCKTQVLMTLKPYSNSNSLSTLLKLSSNLSKIKNFPILNDFNSQSLITQYREKIIFLQQQTGLSVGFPFNNSISDLQLELQQVVTENIQIKDKNERLHKKINQLQEKSGSLSKTKSEMSTQLLATENDKLEISKLLVEMQLQISKLKGENEKLKYDYTTKLQKLENELHESESTKDMYYIEGKQSERRLVETERERRELTDEYVQLKTNYSNLYKYHEKEIRKNEELSVELINLANARTALLRQMEEMKQLVPDWFTKKSNAEIDKLKLLVNGLSSRGLELNTDLQFKKGKLKDKVFGENLDYQVDNEKMRKDYRENRKLLNDKISLKQNQIDKLRKVCHTRETEISSLEAELIVLRNENEMLKTMNNRVQHKLKDLNEDFRSRLIKYVEDISDYVNKYNNHDKTNFQDMKTYLNSMLDDLNKSYKEREEQLSYAAQNFKMKADKTLEDYRKLLVSYRELKFKMENNDFREIANNDLVNELSNPLDRSQDEVLSKPIQGSQHEKYDLGSFRKHLREFTMKTQLDLENERSSLLTENGILNEQVKELQEYIDEHLGRYKNEIMNLKQKSG